MDIHTTTVLIYSVAYQKYVLQPTYVTVFLLKNREKCKYLKLSTNAVEVPWTHLPSSWFKSDIFASSNFCSSLLKRVPNLLGILVVGE